MWTNASCSTMKINIHNPDGNKFKFMGFPFEGAYEKISGEDVFFDGHKHIYLWQEWDCSQLCYISDDCCATWRSAEFEGVYGSWLFSDADVHGRSVWSTGTDLYIWVGQIGGDDSNYELHRIIPGELRTEPVDISTIFPEGGEDESIWTDGEHIYAGFSHIWDGEKFIPKDWGELPEGMITDCLWTDGENIYCSHIGYYNDYDYQYVLNKATGKWEQKVWNIALIGGQWSDGNRVYGCTHEAWPITKYDYYYLEDGKWIPCSFDNKPEHFWHGNIVTDGTRVFYMHSGSGSSPAVVMVPNSAAVYSHTGGGWKKIGNLA